MRNRHAYLEAEYIIAANTLENGAKRDRLAILHRRAKREGFTVLTENIALELAELSDPPEKLKLLDSVLGSKIRGYNQIRAIVVKAEALQATDGGTALSKADVATLGIAYSYLHGQRFGRLFDRCHAALWRAFEADGNTADLLRLFRYSSFVWRIRGEETKETDSAKRLVKCTPTIKESPISADLAARYFWARLKSLGSALKSLTE